MQAFVQIAVDGAKEQEIYDKLSSLEEVKELHILFGEWDMIFKLEIESAEALGTFVMDQIRSLQGVRLTSTMIVAR